MSLITNILMAYDLNDDFTDSTGTLANASNTNITFTSGKINSCGTSNGTNTYRIEIPHNAGFNTDTFTLAFWFKTSTANGFIADKVSGSIHRIRIITGQFYYENVSGGFYNGSGLNDGNWHFAVVKANAGTYYSKIDNGSWTAGTSLSTASGTGVWHWFNSYNNAAGFAGELDMIYFWTRVLSDDEITELYNSGNGLEYPFSDVWSNKIIGVSSPSKVNGVAVGNISKVNLQ